MRRSVPTLLEWGKALHQPVSNQSPFRPLAPIEGGFRIGKMAAAETMWSYGISGSSY